MRDGRRTLRVEARGRPGAAGTAAEGSGSPASRRRGARIRVGTVQAVLTPAHRFSIRFGVRPWRRASHTSSTRSRRSSSWSRMSSRWPPTSTCRSLEKGCFAFAQAREAGGAEPRHDQPRSHRHDGRHRPFLRALRFPAGRGRLLSVGRVRDRIARMPPEIAPAQLGSRRAKHSPDHVSSMAAIL